jgi:hypothetical protein
MHAAIDGEFAIKPSCEWPGLEHRQYGFRRVLPYHFGDEVRQAHAAAAYNALRGEINGARLAPCDYAMYDRRRR